MLPSNSSFTFGEFFISLPIPLLFGPEMLYALPKGPSIPNLQSLLVECPRDLTTMASISESSSAGEVQVKWVSVYAVFVFVYLSLPLYLSSSWGFKYQSILTVRGALLSIERKVQQVGL